MKSAKELFFIDWKSYLLKIRAPAANCLRNPRIACNADFVYQYRWENLKGLSHEIDLKNVDENGQILALLRAAAGF